MRRLLVPAVVALAVGAAVLYLILEETGWWPGGAGRLGEVPAMSAAEAAAHRENRYASIGSLEKLLALPGHFARMDALYALAGRSDSAAVQNLIFQAQGIAAPSVRREFLLVLFARLTELDPRSALALSRTGEFAADPALEREVWQRWGGLDLDAALEHAAAQDNATRHRAAQALLVSGRYADPERAARVTERLGVEPDTRTRAAPLDDLAYTDPAAAIDYVRALESPLHRHQAAAHLGRLLGRNGLEAADRWSTHFRDDALRRAFEEAAARSAAEVDPRGTLERLLGAAEDPAGAIRLAGAFRTIAAQDASQALAWYDLIDDPQQRQRVGRAIATQIAQADPQRALEWARANDRDGLENSLYTSVVAAVADIDPERAIADAMSLDNRWHRMSAFVTVANHLADVDPERAMALVKDVHDPDATGMMMERITMNWMRSDPDAALAWILSADAGQRDELMRAAAQVVPATDLDAAMRLLPQLDKDLAPVWRQQIAANLASQRSIAQAESFVAQFEGTPEYPQLVAGMVQGLAHSDPEAAVAMLDRLPAGQDRHMLSSIVFMNYARQSPREAAEAAASIRDDDVRANVMHNVLQHWARAEPAAAEQWAASRPQGPARDTAIAGVSAQWRELTPARRRLLESIEDPDRRQSAVMNIIFRSAREDRNRALQMLSGIDLPEDQKEQIRQHLDNLPERALFIY